MRRAQVAILLLLLLVASQSLSSVKKSRSGICHPEGSSYYQQTKNFTRYSSIDECLASGGRLPKNHVTAQAMINSDMAYARKHFGSGWNDSDNDCQNTRAELLIKQSIRLVSFTSANGCTVAQGAWRSYFTGKLYTKAPQVDIDHVVPLYWAWHHGAATWSKAERRRFANDNANLIVVEARLNRQKGAKGIDQWLPPSARCQYVLRFLRVVLGYKLQVTDKENSKFKSIRARECS